MSVKILIRRKVTDEKIPELHSLLKKLRSLTLKCPGYISGETLHRAGSDDESLVISTWRSAEEWDEWFNSDERSRIQLEIDLLLEYPTKYEVYRY